MAHPKTSKRSKARTMLRLADLEQSKNAVLHSLGYAIWRAENLSRFSSYLDTHRCRPPNVISAASRDSAKR